jgi:hypothetical protein
LSTAFHLDAIDPAVWRINDNVVGQITTGIVGVVAPFQQFRDDKRLGGISCPDVVPHLSLAKQIVFLKKSELYHFVSFPMADAFNRLTIGRRNFHVWAKIAQTRKFWAWAKNGCYAGAMSA